MLSHSPSLAIIGAGPSGLVAAKYSLQQGYNVTIFEKQSDVGGVWNSFVWPHLTTNISKYTIQFLDWQWHEFDEIYPTKKNMQRFFKEYAENFKVIARILFEQNGNFINFLFF